jgi:hypothetical protein
MKELGMSWSEIKETPRYELTGLMAAYTQYQNLHAYDGYDDKDIKHMAEGKPNVRSDYNRYLSLNEQYKERSGQKRRVQTFKDLI